MDSISTRNEAVQLVQVIQTEASVVKTFLSGRCNNTATSYRKALEDFARFISVDSAETAARIFLSAGSGQANAFALAYKADMLERKLAPATINQRIQVLRSLARFARTIGLVDWSIEVRNSKVVPLRDTRGPGVIGIRLILEQASGTGAKATRDRAIIRLLFDLALRRSEVVALDIGDLEDLEGESPALWVIRKGMTETERLSLPESTRKSISAWMDVRGDWSGPLFVGCSRAHATGRLSSSTVYRIVRGYGEKVGIKVRPHGIRHTAITEAVKKCQESGYPFELALDFSRHTDVRTLIIYRDRERNAQLEVASLVAGSVLD